MQSVLIETFRRHKDKAILVVTAVLALNIWVWGIIFTQHGNSRALSIHFLSVGQGDSQLVVLPSGVKILIDGGPATTAASENISKIISPTDRYIDLVMISHPQLDHFGGLIDVLERYEVGAFLWNGREGIAKAFDELMETLDEYNVQQVVLHAGDRITNDKSIVSILSPTDKLLISKELNDTSIVAELYSAGIRALFTGDIDENIERLVSRALTEPIDVLKVAHHGSRFSSSANFLESIQPLIAVLEVGKNSYGHPTPSVISRLEDSGAYVYRTDIDGTVSVIAENGKLRVLTRGK